MSRIIGFNTQRLYQADGQRISVGLSEDGKAVLFNDHSRGIWGRLRCTSDGPIVQTLRHEGELRRYELQDFMEMVMNIYDQGEYTMDLNADKIHATEWPKRRRI